MSTLFVEETKKARALRLSKEMPYQIYNDSPTIKRYTDWELFEDKLDKSPLAEDKQIIQIDSLYQSIYNSVLRLRNGEAILEKSSDTFEISVLKPEDSDAFRLYEPDEGKLIARHIAGVERPVLLRVGRGEELRVAVIADPPIEGSRFYHLSVKGEETSSLYLDIYFLSRQENGLLSLTVEFEMDKGSKAYSRAFASMRDQSLFSLQRRAILESDSSIYYGLAVLGGRARILDESVQRGKGAASNYSAFLLSSNDGYVEYITNSANVSPITRTEIKVIGFAISGKTFHRGNVRAGKEALSSVNRISSSLIQIGERAVIASVPSLEVDTDYVEEASHNTDISELSEDTMFYIQSRGLSEREAIYLLSRSYIESSLYRKIGEPLDYIERIIEEELLNFLSSVSTDMR